MEPEDEGRLSIVQDVLRKGTDFLRRFIVPVEGQEGSLCRMYAVIVTVCRLRTTYGGSLPGLERSSAAGDVRPAAASTIRKAPTRILVIQDNMIRRDAKVFSAHATPQGVGDNLISALKLLLANQQDGDSPVKMVVLGLQERSRNRIMDGLRKLTALDNYAAALLVVS